MSKDFTAFLVEESFSSVVLNWWVLVMFVTIAVMITLGVNQYHLDRIASDRIVMRRAFGDGVYKIITTISAVIFTPLFVVESGPLLFVWLASFKAENDSPFWVIVITVIAVLFIVAFYVAIVFYIGRAAGLTRRGWISETLEKKRRKQKK